MSAWAKPGAKCVCIDDRGMRRAASEYGLNHPVRGGVYTIRLVERARSNRTGEIETGIRLVEIVNEPRYFGPDSGFSEACWALDCFRPLVTRSQSQDIAEHFKHLLRTPVDRAPLDIPMLDEVDQ